MVYEAIMEFIENARLGYKKVGINSICDVIYIIIFWSCLLFMLYLFCSWLLVMIYLIRPIVLAIIGFLFIVLIIGNIINYFYKE